MRVIGIGKKTRSLVGIFSSAIINFVAKNIVAQTVKLAAKGVAALA